MLARFRFGASGVWRQAAETACGLFVIAICLLVAAPVSAQSPDSILALNRAGEWGRAAELARAALGELMQGDVDPASLPRACELAYHLAYASVRLGDENDASFTVSAYDDFDCDSLLADSWMPREMADLRAQLGAAPPGERGRASGSNADDFWRVASPASVGVDSSALEEHRVLCEATGADACLVVRGGAIVQEWYSARYREPMPAMSTTKSIAGLLVGMLIDDGALELDARVCDYIALWCDGRRARVTVRHLLSMTSGLPVLHGNRSVGFVADKNPYVILLEPAAEPGTQWQYSNEGVQLLEPIMDAAARRPLQDYARERLFEPLGMLDSHMMVDAGGHAWTYADIQTTPRDLARIGLLMLGGGEWQGRRVIGEDWIRESTQPSQEIYEDYGFLWWLHPETPRSYAGHGHLDTDLHVYPDLDLVIMRMQARPVPGLTEGTYDRLLSDVVAKMVR